jgi:uncharacterized phiE125 gp8 family phage protein
MAYQVVTAPSIEPLTLAEAKLHLRVDFTDDDALITMLIAAARQYAEQRTARSFITTVWKYVADSFPGVGVMGVPWGREYSHPGNAILLEKGQVQSIDSIQYLDMSGTLQTVATSLYTSDLTGSLARIAPKFGQIWPITLPQLGAVTVNFTAGYGATAASVPEGLKAWLKLRIGALYENREEVVAGRSITVSPMPFVDGLLDGYNIIRV